ncbi:MAG: hypothetical protein WKF37_00150 [Bryobacteraceae bacterium]
MTSLKSRVIGHELLDELPQQDAAASLHDLVRINRWLGGHEILKRL